MHFERSSLSKSRGDLHCDEVVPPSDNEIDYTIPWIDVDLMPLPRRNGYYLIICDESFQIAKYDKDSDGFERVQIDPWKQIIDESKVTHWIKIEKPNTVNY